MSNGLLCPCVRCGVGLVKLHSFIHGDGSNKRNYVYAEDVARAFDLILHKGAIGNIYIYNI